jgi:uncharacterized protein YprB with RNaseH-like and TPR domain
VRVENSFIAVEGVGEATERDLWSSGVTHWDDFRADALGPKTGERVATFISEGRKRLSEDDSDFFADALPAGEEWRLYENFRDDAAFFDIETTGLDERANDVTTVSVHRGGETETLVRGRDLTTKRLHDLIADAPLAVSFNGKRFDTPFLEANFDVDLDTPHLDLMYACKRIGLSGGLKAVEPEVGIERERPDISGRDAVRLWREHERGQSGSLETLVEYNREDAVNLKALADETTERLHRDVFEG